MMRPWRSCALAVAAVCGLAGAAPRGGPAPPPDRGVLLGALTWTEAEKRLTPQAVVVIPLGAGAKEHGPHLKLDNDLRIAESFKERVLRAADVVVAPTIPYSFYPAFVEYPGSTTLGLETARDLVVDLVRSLARHGPRRFYVLNTGISTRRPLRAAAEALAGNHIMLRFTDLETAGAAAVKQVRREEGGTHADEIETSMMLYIDPLAVDMTKAVKDFHPGDGPLTRDPAGPGVYSPTGVWGDATLATREKGRIIVEAMLKDILADIESLRSAPLP